MLHDLRILEEVRRWALGEGYPPADRLVIMDILHDAASEVERRVSDRT
jgi:hypothetical protein